AGAAQRKDDGARGGDRERVGRAGRRHRAQAPRGERERGAPDRRHRGGSGRARDPEREQDAAVSDRGQQYGVGSPPPPLPLPRPAPRGAPREHRLPPRDDEERARLSLGRRISRDRNTAPRETDARRGSRPHGAVPAPPRQVLRAAAIAPALQAGADGGGVRPLLPDRALPSRRGPARG